MIRSSQYTIDLIQKVQTKVSTKYKRDLRRTVVSAAAAPATTVATFAQWSVQTDSGSSDYSSTDSQAIEIAHKAGSGPITLNANGYTYVIDVSNMTQTNTSTKKVRKIQRNLVSSTLIMVPITPVLSTAPGCTLTKLTSTSPKHIKVKAQFEKTMNGKYTTFEVTELDNKTLKGLFKSRRDYIQNLSGGTKPKVMELFHGTSSASPALIYNGFYEGFDTQYSADSGYWGRGVYFAVNASYSDSYTHKNNGMKEMLVAKVVVGNFKDYGTTQDSSLKHPPKVPGEAVKRYDSVKGNTGGSDVYMIYNGNQAYPKYLISYK